MATSLAMLGTPLSAAPTEAAVARLGGTPAEMWQRRGWRLNELLGRLLLFKLPAVREHGESGKAAARREGRSFEKGQLISRCESLFRGEWPALFEAPCGPWARFYARPARPAQDERAAQQAAERRCHQGELTRGLAALVRTGSFSLSDPRVLARLRELTPARVSEAEAAARRAQGGASGAGGREEGGGGACAG